MLVVIRADASTTIGSGHVMRCLALAENLRDHGADVLFVGRDLPGNAGRTIAARGFRFAALPSTDEPDPVTDARETQSAMRLSGIPHADWLIVDHYGLGAQWESAIRSSARKLLAIDDLANRVHECDLLLDQNLIADLDQRYLGLVPQNAGLLLGPEYALLQREYAVLHQQAKQRSGPVRRLLASFGGTDEFDMAQKTIAAFSLIDPQGLELDIVVPSTHPRLSALAREAESRPNVRLHIDLATLAPLMLEADLAIGAGGATSWERLCLRLPALVVTLADNQKPVAAELDRLGLVRWLGDAGTVTAEGVAEAVAEYIQLPTDSRPDFDSPALVDGKGAGRVLTVMTVDRATPLAARRATTADETFLLRLRNDPSTRASAFNSEVVDPDSHSLWYRRRLSQEHTCRIFVIETLDGVAVGQTRFDREEETWIVDYAVVPAFRGRGLGAGILKAGIEALLAGDQSVSRLQGSVRQANVASQRIFERLGFEKSSSGHRGLVYQRTF